MNVSEEQIKSLTLATKKKLIREFYANNLIRYFEDLVYTLDEYDSTGHPIKKYPIKDWPYLKDLIKDIHTEKWLYLWKSRQVMATWTLVAYGLWLVLFHQGRKVAVQGEKSDKANALLQRMKIIYDHLPAWKPMAEFTECHIAVPEMLSDVYGIASGGDQLRSFSFSWIMSDEFGFQTKLEESFGAAKPIVDAGGRFVACTTPPREKNYAYNLFRNNLFKVVSLHYSLVPGRDQEWAKVSRAGWSEDDWAREQELTLVAPGVKRLFPAFSVASHVNQHLCYNSQLPIYRSWDFGFHRPATSFYQIDNQDRVNKLAEILGHDELIDTYADRVLAFGNIHFPNASYVDFCDIAGTQVNDKTEKTSIQILNSKGIYPRYRKVNDEDGFSTIRRKMTTFIGDRPAYQVHSNCVVTIDGFIFGAIYKDDGITPKGDGLDEQGLKEKDYYLHLVDTDKYFFVNIYGITGKRQDENLKLSALKNPVIPNTYAKVTEKINPHAWMTGYQKAGV